MYQMIMVTLKRIGYMKRFQKITRKFLFPEIDELGLIKDDDIVCILPAPKPCAATKHLPEIFKFEKISKTLDGNLQMCNQIYIFIFSISCKIKLVFFKICNVNIKNAEKLVSLMLNSNYFY